MPRYYRRRYKSYRSGKSKYSNETTVFAIDESLTAGLAAKTTFPQSPNKGWVIVGPTETYGTRKVKNFDIQLTYGAGVGPLYGALVYVPQGTTAGNIMNADFGTSLYEPNQNVISSFLIPPPTSNGQLIHIKSRLARNLDSGDSIVLILSNLIAQPVNEYLSIAGQVNYAIRY